MISFRSVLDRREVGAPDQIEAGELLGISEPNFHQGSAFVAIPGVDLNESSVFRKSARSATTTL